MTEKELKRILRILYYRKEKLNFFFVYPFYFFVFFSSATFESYTNIINYLLTVPVISFLFSYKLSSLFSLPKKSISELLFYQKKYFQINDNFIEIYYEDRSHLKINIKNYTKATQEDSYFFLYTKNFHEDVIRGYEQFECIPIRAFNSEDEVKVFIEILKQKGLLN